MPFMPEDVKNKKENNKGKKSVPLEKEIKPSNKNIDTIAGTPEVDLLKEKDSVTAQEVLASKKPKEPEIFGQPLFSWQALEYIHYEKSSLWYLTILVSAVLAIGITIYFAIHSRNWGNWILIPVIIMLVVVLFQYSKRKPNVRNYSLSENGIKIDNKVYLFKQLKSFWFIESSEETSLNFQPLKRLSLIITIPLADVKIDDLRLILGQYLPEEKREEDLIDRVSKKLKF
jgi:hypothetical protein